MFKRVGHCNKCAKCCESFNLLAGAMSDFKRANIQLTRNPDGTYRCSKLEDGLCSIHESKPNACKNAPRGTFPWDCGYRFIEVKQPRKEKRETKKTIHLLSEIDPKEKMSDHAKEIFEYGREYLNEV